VRNREISVPTVRTDNWNGGSIATELFLQSRGRRRGGRRSFYIDDYINSNNNVVLHIIYLARSVQVQVLLCTTKFGRR
jgi:hypothetical protein